MAILARLPLRHVAEVEDVTGPADTWQKWAATGRRRLEVGSVPVTPWLDKRHTVRFVEWWARWVLGVRA